MCTRTLDLMMQGRDDSNGRIGAGKTRSSDRGRRKADNPESIQSSIKTEKMEKKVSDHVFVVRAFLSPFFWTVWRDIIKKTRRKQKNRRLRIC